jgi:protein-disulfide isomerase
MKLVTGAALILVGVLLSGCFGEPAKGPADAKVTITEYSDFECPYCARFVADTLPKIEANYGDRVLFVFRNYPLPANMHPYAEKAAEAGECVNDQGRFWEYHDLLFQNQSQLAALIQQNAKSGVAQVIDELKRYAASLNLDMTLFDQCLDLGQDVDKVTADHSALDDYARANGVDRVGAPSFLINDKFVTGAYPFDESSPGYQKGMFTFKAAIDEALAAAQ